MIIAILAGTILGTYICRTNPMFIGTVGVNQFMSQIAPPMAIALKY